MVTTCPHAATSLASPQPSCRHYACGTEFSRPFLPRHHPGDAEAVKAPCITFFPRTRFCVLVLRMALPQARRSAPSLHSSWLLGGHTCRTQRFNARPYSGLLPLHPPTKKQCRHRYLAEHLAVVFCEAPSKAMLESCSLNTTCSLLN